MILERSTTIPGRRLDEVFEFFSDPMNLARITPESLGFEILEAPSRKLREGDRIRYRIRLFGVPLRWVTLIEEWRDGHSFVDLQERGPYRLWRHLHEFVEVPEGVQMLDRVEYELPLGIPGRVFGGWLVRRQLDAIFDFRGRVIREMFSERNS